MLSLHGFATGLALYAAFSQSPYSYIVGLIAFGMQIIVAGMMIHRGDW